MRVAVLGAGGLGLAYTAFLIEHGHDPILWSPSGAGTSAFRDSALLVATGQVTGSFSLQIATSCQEALEGADVVLVALRGNGHRAIFDQAVEFLRPNQMVVISSHSSLGALYLSKRLVGLGIHVPVTAWGTTVLTAHRKGEAGVDIPNYRAKVDMATVPVTDQERGLQACQAMFGDHFQVRADVMAISLSNINPISHMSNALCNLTRIERAEEWANYDCITGAVGRLIEALDKERLAVADAYGVSVRTFQEHNHLSFGVRMGTVAEMSAAIHAIRGGPPGPKSLDSRYVTEDVPFGLVPAVAIGRTAGIPMPLHEAGIKLFSALYGRDFSAENDILPELGLDGMDAETLHRLVRNGWDGKD